MTTRYLSLLLMVFATVMLSGCWGDPYGCDDADEPHHCLQEAAVSAGDASVCDGISKSKAKELGVSSNPPKDKCYLMVAVENSDYSICDKIKGGEMSYSPAECIMEIIAKNGDVGGCERLAGTDKYEECNQNFRSAQALTMKDYEIQDLTDQLKNDPDNEQLKQQLQKIMDQKQNVFEALSEEEKNAYVKEQREKIMENIDDPELTSAIAKEFTAFKTNNPNATINETLEAMKNATDRQIVLKALDDDANTLVDTVKQQMMDIAEEQQNALLDGAKGKALDRLKENGGKDMERSLQRLERLKENYDSASEQYEAIQAKYDELKAVYDGIQDVYKKMDSFDTLVAQGKITAEKAKVLKGAVLLQKGLTSVTEYVPVFGSTISKVTDETFNATIKFAEKRAQRATALDKCIEDPLNCDTDNISGY